MSDPLESAKYTLAHAKRHIKNFDALHRGFIHSDPYATVVEFGFPNIDIHKIKLVKPMPEPLAGVAFDTLNSLRAVLDQSTFAIAVAAGTNGKKAHFPFGDTLSEVEDRRKAPRGGSHQLPKEIFDFIVTLKPYKGGNNFLWAVNKLCNSNKHEVIVPVAIFAGGGSIDHARIDGALEFNFPPIWDGTKNEMVLAVVKRGSKPDYDLKVATFIAFANVDGIRNKPALNILSNMAIAVERAVVGLEAEARRLGLFK